VSAQDKPILVDAPWLKQHLNDPNVVVLQVSFLKLDYVKEHMEGARFLWPGWLAPDTPDGSFNAPDPEKAAEVLRTLGISNHSHVVICHVRNEVSPSARMFLALEDLGLRGNVSFLNGGLEAWKKEGYPVTTIEPVVKKGNFKPKPAGLLVDKNYVLKALGNTQQVVVDARAKRYYDGEPTGYPRDGHIKGAKNIPFQDLVDQSNVFKPNDQLKAYFTPVVAPEQEVIAYCFIGQTASVVYLAGRVLGYNMKLYDGSMQEWSRIEELPMEVTPK
jgi:thiosulfate/3-mercaptopyruvate sulfurtransferase